MACTCNALSTIEATICTAPGFGDRCAPPSLLRLREGVTSSSSSTPALSALSAAVNSPATSIGITPQPPSEVEACLMHPSGIIANSRWSGWKINICVSPSTLQMIRICLRMTSKETRPCRVRTISHKISWANTELYQATVPRRIYSVPIARKTHKKPRRTYTVATPTSRIRLDLDIPS